MDGAFAIRLAAFGVAVCKMGLLMVGLTSAVGGFVFTGEEEEEEGGDMTGDEAAATLAVVVVGEVAVVGSLLLVVVVVVVLVAEMLVETGESPALLLSEKGETVTVVTLGRLVTPGPPPVLSPTFLSL